MKKHYRDEPIENINKLQEIVNKARAIALALGQPDAEYPDSFHYEEDRFRFTGNLVNPTTWVETRKSQGNWIPQLWMAQDGSLSILKAELDSRYQPQWLKRLEALYESLPDAVA